MKIKTITSALCLLAMSAAANCDDVLPFPRAYTSLGGFAKAPEVVEARDASLPPEGYRLEVRQDSARITAADDRGAFYARETLRQLTGADGRVPCCRVSDHPAYPFRSMMIDEGRHFFGKAFVQIGRAHV